MSDSEYNDYDVEETKADVSNRDTSETRESSLIARRKALETYVNYLKRQGHHKISGEIDVTIKKINEGVDAAIKAFEEAETTRDLHTKDKAADTAKKEVRKLQKLRDSLTNWITNPKFKDKELLQDSRKLIERQMSRWKTLEKTVKMKEYSEVSLASLSKHVNPIIKERDGLRIWLVNGIDRLKQLIDLTESEIETLRESKGRKADKESELTDLKNIIKRHEFHMGKFETMLKMLHNRTVESDEIVDFIRQVSKIKDDIEYYLDSHRDPDFEEDEFMYDEVEGLSESAVVVPSTSMLVTKTEVAEVNAPSDVELLSIPSDTSITINSTVLPPSDPIKFEFKEVLAVKQMDSNDNQQVSTHNIIDEPPMLPSLEERIRICRNLNLPLDSIRSFGSGVAKDLIVQKWVDTQEWNGSDMAYSPPHSIQLSETKRNEIEDWEQELDSTSEENLSCITIKESPKMAGTNPKALKNQDWQSSQGPERKNEPREQEFRDSFVCQEEKRQSRPRGRSCGPGPSSIHRSPEVKIQPLEVTPEDDDGGGEWYEVRRKHTHKPISQSQPAVEADKLHKPTAASEPPTPRPSTIETTATVVPTRILYRPRPYAFNTRPPTDQRVIAWEKELFKPITSYTAKDFRLTELRPMKLDVPSGNYPVKKFDSKEFPSQAPPSNFRPPPARAMFPGVNPSAKLLNGPLEFIRHDKSKSQEFPTERVETDSPLLKIPAKVVRPPRLVRRLPPIPRPRNEFPDHFLFNLGTYVDPKLGFKRWSPEPVMAPGLIDPPMTIELLRLYKKIYRGPLHYNDSNSSETKAPPKNPKDLYSWRKYFRDNKFNPKRWKPKSGQMKSAKLPNFLKPQAWAPPKPLWDVDEIDKLLNYPRFGNMDKSPLESPENPRDDTTQQAAEHSWCVTQDIAESPKPETLQNEVSDISWVEPPKQSQSQSLESPKNKIPQIGKEIEISPMIDAQTQVPPHIQIPSVEVYIDGAKYIPELGHEGPSPSDDTWLPPYNSSHQNLAFGDNDISGSSSSDTSSLECKRLSPPKEFRDDDSDSGDSWHDASSDGFGDDESGNGGDENDSPSSSSENENGESAESTVMVSQYDIEYPPLPGYESEGQNQIGGWGRSPEISTSSDSLVGQQYYSHKTFSTEKVSSERQSILTSHKSRSTSRHASTQTDCNCGKPTVADAATNCDWDSFDSKSCTEETLYFDRQTQTEQFSRQTQTEQFFRQIQTEEFSKQTQTEEFSRVSVFGAVVPPPSGVESESPCSWSPLFYNQGIETQLNTGGNSIGRFFVPPQRETQNGGQGQYNNRPPPSLLTPDIFSEGEEFERDDEYFRANGAKVGPIRRPGLWTGPRLAPDGTGVILTLKKEEDERKDIFERIDVDWDKHGMDHVREKCREYEHALLNPKVRTGPRPEIDEEAWDAVRSGLTALRIIQKQRKRENGYLPQKENKIDDWDAPLWIQGRGGFIFE